ncbi:LacI family DNA-binding transcriptional regulator [Sphingomonas sp. 1P06PA]|uniref:LacI family DNA-binding transcriptional regulator n=1 Tax=Sphingomonas sp. 1P06PA TaxID=554121 RepID=UPI0039A59CD8
MAHATIRDVARMADVSVASASRALNGMANVRAATADRVRAAADALGYVPHAGARSLSIKRAHAIGVVLPDLHGEFFSELVRGMDRQASRLGFNLLLSNMHADPDQAIAALRAMRGRVDGLVVMAPHLDTAAILAGGGGALPAILINTAGDTQGRGVIRVDNRAGAEAMVAHLLAIGRTRIAHLAGPRGNADAEQRIEGFNAALKAAGITRAPLMIAGDFTDQAGADAVAALLPRLDEIDAIFAANDMMALGCLMALREHGIHVPDRIAVAGFDDVPIARYVTPALTTMRIDVAALGERAVARLADAIDARPESGAVEIVTPELVIRGTTSRRDTGSVSKGEEA